MTNLLFFFAEDMSTLTPAQRLQFLEKARAKKAQVEKAQAGDKVDVLSQLEVVEGERKKRKSGDARVNIPVKASSSDAAIADRAADVGDDSRVKSPAKKRSKSLIKKNKKSSENLVVEKDLQEVGDAVAEVFPIGEKTVAEASQAGGASPWDPLFNLEVFLERMVDMAGNSSRFSSTGTDELLRMALGHELKGLLLNYALTARQRAEVAVAKETEALVNKNLVALEEDVASTKAKLESDVKTLKQQGEEEIAKLRKAHEEELAKVKRDHESMQKTLKVTQDSLDAKDQRIKSMAKDNEAALSELAALRAEKEEWASAKENLEEQVGAQFDEGFNFALDQVKVLFPDIDQDLLGKAYAMSRIEGDKLVPYAPVETVHVDEPFKRNSFSPS
jgi:hypothetical protein